MIDVIFSIATQIVGNGYNTKDLGISLELKQGEP